MSRIVAITGNRNCHDQALVTQVMAAHLQETDTVWVGGSAGVELLAAKQAKAWGVETETVLAHWKEEGDTNPNAGRERYQNMAENCDVVLVIWDGLDQPMTHLIQTAIECNREVHCYPWKRS